MPLGSLLTPASGGLRAYTMILIFSHSQVLTLLLQSSQPQYLKRLQQAKLFQLLWKSQQLPTKTLVEGKELRPPRVRLQMLLLRSLNKWLTTKLPRLRPRIFVFSVVCFFFFYVCCFKDLYCVLIINEDIPLLFHMLWQVIVNLSAVISLFLLLVLYE